MINCFKLLKVAMLMTYTPERLRADVWKLDPARSQSAAVLEARRQGPTAA
jgi:hypothetical protein